MRPKGLKYKNRIELPAPILASLMKVRADGGTYQDARDVLRDKHGLTLSVSKVYKLCQSFPTPKDELRPEVRRAVSNGMSRKAAAEKYGISLTTAYRWCDEL